MMDREEDGVNFCAIAFSCAAPSRSLQTSQLLSLFCWYEVCCFFSLFAVVRRLGVQSMLLTRIEATRK